MAIKPMESQSNSYLFITDCLFQHCVLQVDGHLEISVCTKGFEVQCPTRVFGSFRWIQLETDEECREQTLSIKKTRRPLSQHVLSNK